MNKFFDIYVMKSMQRSLALILLLTFAAPLAAAEDPPAHLKPPEGIRASEIQKV